MFDYIDNLDTLLAVIVGALLATGGAMVAELVQDRLGRKRKEREAARFFGEILTSADRVLDRAFASMEIGEAWGNVSKRLFRTALDETAVYERNRERLFDIRDIPLRRAIHLHFLEETVPLVALVETWDEIDEIEKELTASDHLSEARLRYLQLERQKLQEARDAALASTKGKHAETDQICELLEPIAAIEFRTRSN
ncbi:MAG: hypothetical protein AAFQ15_04975 [Pseudomonadota bacterium]